MYQGNLPSHVTNPKKLFGIEKFLYLPTLSPSGSLPSFSLPPPFLSSSHSLPSCICSSFLSPSQSVSSQLPFLPFPFKFQPHPPIPLFLPHPSSPLCLPTGQSWHILNTLILLNKCGESMHSTHCPEQNHGQDKLTDISVFFVQFCIMHCSSAFCVLVLYSIGAVAQGHGSIELLHNLQLSE